MSTITFKIPTRTQASPELPRVLQGGILGDSVSVVDSFEMSNNSNSGFGLISRREMEAAGRPTSNIRPQVRNKIDSLSQKSPIDSVYGLSRNSNGGIRVTFELPQGATQELWVAPVRGKDDGAVRLLPASNDRSANGAIDFNGDEVDYFNQKMTERLDIPMSEDQRQFTNSVLSQLSRVN